LTVILYGAFPLAVFVSVAKLVAGDWFWWIRTTVVSLFWFWRYHPFLLLRTFLWPSKIAGYILW